MDLMVKEKVCILFLFSVLYVKNEAYDNIRAEEASYFTHLPASNHVAGEFAI